MSLTVGQFAALTCIHPSTVRQYIEQGQLEAVRISNRFQIAEEELVRYLSEGLRPKRLTEDQPRLI